MDKELAIHYLKTLYFVYNQASLERPETRDFYVRIIMEFDESVVQTGIDNIIRSSKFCPKPAELLDEFKRLQGNSQKTVNKEYCPVCDNTGIITHRTEAGDFALYCTECAKGLSQKYDGRRCKPSTDYYTPPVTKYYDVEKLKAKNIFEKSKSGVAMPMPEEIKRNFKFLGRVI
jgi:hypothetical protein